MITATTLLIGSLGLCSLSGRCLHERELLPIPLEHFEHDAQTPEARDRLALAGNPDRKSYELHKEPIAFFPRLEQDSAQEARS